MLENGVQAPEFTLPSTDPDGGTIGQVTLSDILADGPALVNFYVFDFHPACTENVCDLHDLAWFDLDASLSVVGISTDSVFSHRAFASAEEIDVPLLSDSDGSVAAAYGVLYDEFRGHREVAKRAVFLIRPDGTVAYTWHTDDPGEQPDFDAVKRAVESLRAADSE